MRTARYMADQRSERYVLWLRFSGLIIFWGLAFVVLQLADLSVLQSFAPGGWGLRAAGLEPVVYVPTASSASRSDSGFSNVRLPEPQIAEVGDGGDLAARARRVLQAYRPYLFARERNGVLYVALLPLIEALGGELLQSPDSQRLGLLWPDTLIVFTPDIPVIERNGRTVALPEPLRLENGELWAPVRTLELLCNATLKGERGGDYFKLTRGADTFYIISRPRLYTMEVSRSGRWLQIYCLGVPIKRYPICVGAGDNTPVGHFHIQNKAVWPPWHAYWGEYMPGGSRRNPLGARWLGTTARGRATGRVIGIHGTNQPSSIGQRISGGCMRLYNHHAIELYNNIPIGTRLWIHE